MSKSKGNKKPLKISFPNCSQLSLLETISLNSWDSGSRLETWKCWLASKRWDELVFARSPGYKEVLPVFYSCASFLASGKHQKSGSLHSWITQKHCVSLWKLLFWKLLFYNSKLPTEKPSLKKKKKEGYFSICSVLPKDRHFLFRRSHQIRGHYRKIRKKIKAMSSVICIGRNWTEYQRLVVYKTIGKNLLSLSYRPPECFTLTLMKNLSKKVSKMAFKYSGGRVHCKRTPNFHHLPMTAMVTPIGHNSRSNAMSE